MGEFNTPKRTRLQIATRLNIMSHIWLIHLVRTYEGERGSRKSVRHAYKRDAFCYILICKMFLSYFSVFGDDFPYCSKKHLL